MAFDAAQEVEDLDYDLSKYVEGAQGTIPEPTSDQVENLFKAIRALAVSAGIKPGASREEAIQAFAQIPEDQQKAQAAATMEALIEFCAGSPSGEQIRELPYRPLNAFLGWVIGQFSPDLGKVATSPSPATANGALPNT